jgi:hypothetical protein
MEVLEQLIGMLFIETYVLVASLIAIITVLLRSSFPNNLKGNIWFTPILLALFIVTPCIVIIIVSEFGSLGAIYRCYINLYLQLNPDVIDVYPFLTPDLVRFTIRDNFIKILIADAIGVLVGFGIRYVVLKKSKSRVAQ